MDEPIDLDNPNHYQKIDELTAQGLLDRDAVLYKLTRRICKFGVIESEKELPHLRGTFDSLAVEENGIQVLTQSAFLSFLESTGFLSPSMREAGALVYRSLLYLSQYPFHHPIPDSLTYMGLLRALAWTMPGRVRPVHEACRWSRSRSPADSRRQFFQSLATARDGKSIPFDAEYAKAQAQRRASDFTCASHDCGDLTFPKTNYDDHGDEMFHDILDALFSIQPQIVWLVPSPRDYFRATARKLASDERLHDLSIPQDQFRAVVKLLMTTFFRKPQVPVQQLVDLDHVVDCMVGPAIQRPDIGITWDMYDQAARNGMPMLVDGLMRLLTPFYRDPEDKYYTLDIPQSGKVATFAVFAQMASLRILAVTRELQQYVYYDLRTTSLTASTIAERLNAYPEAAIVLLLSGKNSETGKKTIFGYYIPRLAYGNTPFLFQLSDIQDSFRGNGPRPGHELDGGELVIGQRGNGAAVMLRQDARRAIVSHNVSDQFQPMYAANTWRGDWQIEFDVEEIEMWLEDGDTEGATIEGDEGQ
ncbi:hypothetical protein ANOM_009595 [Aspergillus nomiae NRRL 13137]|uniref:Uncharacterized protein n=1 Tax=Aspergillus nomiae NRRL (strain ATCC 15546 / NRRL 13137 / CBS 260.88 / M93) TaxID=1509407 RepID=A0A0L1IU67_ASPN3|nr:uncharacterized protein ANOM_009595 [Aspergillus nomiae NRRL 13137]KNG83014.1 hypothetical protein ANOM_009595 [Aspergillus nomiae NRRL 13137]